MPPQKTTNKKRPPRKTGTPKGGSRRVTGNVPTAKKRVPASTKRVAATKKKKPRGRRSFLVLILLLLVGGLAVYNQWEDRIRTEIIRRSIATMSDEQAQQAIWQFTELGEPGADALAWALGSQREPVAMEACKAANHYIERAENLSVAERTERLKSLALAIEKHSNSYGSSAKDSAASLARKMLLHQQKVGQKNPESLVLLVAACDNILEFASQGPDGNPDDFSQGPRENNYFANGNELATGKSYSSDADLKSYTSLPSLANSPILPPENARSGYPGQKNREAGDRLIRLSNNPTAGLFAATDELQTAVANNDTTSNTPPGVGRQAIARESSNDPNYRQATGLAQNAPGTMYAQAGIAKVNARGALEEMPVSQANQAFTQESLPQSPTSKGVNLKNYSYWDLLSYCIDNSNSVASREEREFRGISWTEVHLAKKLFSASPHERLELVSNLRAVNSFDKIKWFQRLAQDNDRNVRKAAITSLIATNDPLVLREVATLCAEDSDLEIRKMADRLRQDQRRRR